jgi:hypothetical protein
MNTGLKSRSCARSAMVPMVSRMMVPSTTMSQPAAFMLRHLRREVGGAALERGLFGEVPC